MVDNMKSSKRMKKIMNKNEAISPEKFIWETSAFISEKISDLPKEAIYPIIMTIIFNALNNGELCPECLMDNLTETIKEMDMENFHDRNIGNFH